jgi:hypothetical protein
MKFTFSRKAGGLIMLALLTGIFSQGLWAQTVSGVMTRDANMRKGPSADTAIVIILKTCGTE